MTNAKNHKKRIFEIIQIGSREDWLSRLFDVIIMFLILLNLFIVIFETFERSAQYRYLLDILELITVLAFTVEYGLRLWTAEYLYPQSGPVKAPLRYALSFGGLIDLLSFLPYYLPLFFPAGVVAFRMFRVIRILRLFRVNAYYDALNVITAVLKSKRDQLFSSIFIILVLMTASSLCMYSLEHEAQPEVFCNAFSGFWWSVSTLLTVGYGDIYPITVAGRIFGILITFLGVGMVAIPTGILSAGFVEHYGRMKNIHGMFVDEAVTLSSLLLDASHPWCGAQIRELGLPRDCLIVLVKRNGQTHIPNGSLRLRQNDCVYFYTNSRTPEEMEKLLWSK